ncbi:Pentatricopeptide repeat (PPR) superfamily protein [Thalictrum thalictroides]|uniref:Pentatricopeptide repeat (PPR) superfamily protein n=1 Tax=Thalictrum thalictroides TaxID=46969 RepID=A0A7J6XDT0_THATH|nr:Pentatricopeptide repeat (PPR) superfamily protein [Thalictrum thalictroides]
MEMLVKKYQQKYSKVREEMDRWDELQSRLLRQFRNASSIIERLEVLQDLQNYGALKSIVGIREAILGKQMSSLEVILQSLKDTMQEFNGIVMSFEKILRDGKHLANGASRPLTENQKQQRVGIQPSIADCMDGLEFIYKRHHAEYHLKLSTVSSLMSKKPPPSASDFGALQQLLTDQPNIAKEEVQSIFDIIFAGELC